MKRIPLNHGQTALIDNSDYKLIKEYKWRIDKGNSCYYAITNTINAEGKKVPIRMHTILMNTPPGMQVDHINGDGLDNRRCNLRICTNSQNRMNQHKAIGRSKYKGVTWHSIGKKWQARININGKHTHLGLFKKEENAAEAYNRAAKEHFGEFANLNELKGVAA